jgi:hypothetical protein
MLKLGVLAITLASLVASVVYLKTDGMRPEEASFVLGAITEPMAWNFRNSLKQLFWWAWPSGSRRLPGFMAACTT